MSKTQKKKLKQKAKEAKRSQEGIDGIYSILISI